MKILDKFSRILGSGPQETSETESHILDVYEIRLIAEGNLEKLADFAASGRLHATDPKGDTSLHLAARMGNLALCDLFIRSGAVPDVLNHERLTPADVAHAEGHRLVSQLLSSLGAHSQEYNILNSSEQSPILDTTADTIEATSQTHQSVVNETDLQDDGRRRQEGSMDTSWADDRVELLKRMWSEGRSANQISRELGGVSRNAVLSKAHRLGLWEREGGEASSSETISEVPVNVVGQPKAAPEQRLSSKIAQAAAAINQLDDLDDSLIFEAEKEPREFFGETATETVSGTFVAIVSPAPVVSDNEDGDWDLDLSPVLIAGEGIGTAAPVITDRGEEHDFLKVRKRGRQSFKRAVLQTGTRLSIYPENCITWAGETLAKGWCSFSDVENLVVLCEGNGDLDELCANLLRNLEAAGFDLVYESSGHTFGLWDIGSHISSDELAEAIEATLTRSTRLPGTQRFVMDKSDELQLLEPMVRAKQELHLGILASEAAVQTILEVFDSIRGGVRDPVSVSLKNIIPSRPGHTDTAEVMAAAEALKFWQENGRVMDGKRRRQALAALEELDLSLAFQKELVGSLEQSQANPEHANWLDTQISAFEIANERLIQEHLPFARRFAARSVEEGEDPEDVFQVAFMGLQRSTRRFDPERGYRFMVYASYWMRQAIMRWRADEGSMIRIPVQRKEKITRLELAMERLDVRADGIVSDNDLAADLDWTTDEVWQFRGIPREAIAPETWDDWDQFSPTMETVDPYDRIELEQIISEILATLPARKAEILRLRFGIGRDGDDMTLEEVGQIYGVTRERIRQIEAEALRKLKHPSNSARLRIFSDS